MSKKITIELPEIHRINGAVTGTPIYSYDKETYHSSPELAAAAFISAQQFWAKYFKEREKEDAIAKSQKRK